jgi:hypothetical protein
MHDTNTNPGNSSTASLRAQLISDAVVAAYINEISRYQHAGGPAALPLARSRAGDEVAARR